MSNVHRTIRENQGFCSGCHGCTRPCGKSHTIVPDKLAVGDVVEVWNHRLRKYEHHLILDPEHIDVTVNNERRVYDFLSMDSSGNINWHSFSALNTYNVRNH